MIGTRVHVLSPGSKVTVVYRAVPCTRAQFEEMWSLHPEEHQSVVIRGKAIPIPRYQALYGASTYSFSGITMTPSLEIPLLVQNCMDYATRTIPEFTWNGALVNWYEDGSHYIGPHSDDTRDLVPGSPILSFSFGATRVFRITRRADFNHPKSLKSLDIDTVPSSLIIMSGKMQEEYKHAITKTSRVVGKRINVTIRAFRQVSS